MALLDLQNLPQRNDEEPADHAFGRTDDSTLSVLVLCGDSGLSLLLC